MAKYQAYAEYKDSGVEWLGEIPSHWDLYSLKRSVDKCTNGFWGGEPDGRNDLCVLRVADFNRDNFTINEDKLTLRSVLPKEAESRLLKKGDLLIEKSGGGEKTLVGCVVQFDKDFPAITSNFVAKMTPNVITDSKYLTYAFAHLYSGRVNFPSIKQTTGIQNLDSEAYLMEKFGFPSKNEQTQIASFLDHETAQIDTLIAKQEKLIELLKEKRQAVISHAVTKGLNPNVPMKDSGVEWLGEVPEHWAIPQIGYHAEVTKLTGFEYTNLWAPNDDGEIIALRGFNIQERYLDLNKTERISQKLSYKLIRSKLYKNDLVLPCTGTLGNAALIDKDNTYHINQNIAKVTYDKKLFFPEFCLYWMTSLPFRQMIDFNNTSGMQPVLLIGDIRKLPIVLPPLSEQVEVVSYLNIKTQKFDSLIKKAESAISLMQERRTALISAAVTGKIDVRHWQAPTLAEAHTELNA